MILRESFIRRTLGTVLAGLFPQNTTDPRISIGAMSTDGTIRIRVSNLVIRGSEDRGSQFLDITLHTGWPVFYDYKTWMRHLETVILASLFTNSSMDSQ